VGTTELLIGDIGVFETEDDFPRSSNDENIDGGNTDLSGCDGCIGCTTRGDKSTTVEDGDGKNLDLSRLLGVLSPITPWVGVCRTKPEEGDPITGDLEPIKGVVTSEGPMFDKPEFPTASGR
jgi:hypothetical protein